MSTDNILKNSGKTPEDTSQEEEIVTVAGSPNYKDLYIRILAYFENYRKKKNAEIEVIKNNANIEFVRDLLPLIDNIERGAKNGDKFSIMMYIEFTKLLLKYGIKRYGDVGEKFNSDFHDAAYITTNKKVKKGCISEILTYGYKKGDEIIRYAKVNVEGDA